ncbi:golgin subfamily A member 2-like isoform X2 [Portunus trituberculatus]|uniref:golgin subfamily A member 2-like isoform X2 n=1 Tax=Portunus trituberculatus TaxID=210409 RepID=UPI001E1D0DFA|nr:golgin subfamily A member 2-like isoform X2 [Portunus trituberculatus]
MADSVREQKLVAARRKLRQFQKKKGTKSSSVSHHEGFPKCEIRAYEDEAPLSEAGTLSSFASSVDLASEEMTDMIDEAAIQVNTEVLRHENAVLPNCSQSDRQETASLQGVQTSHSTLPASDSQTHTTCSQMDQPCDVVLHNNPAPGTIQVNQEHTTPELNEKLLSPVAPPSEGPPISESPVCGFNQTLGEDSPDLSVGGNIHTGHEQLAGPLFNTLQMDSEAQESHISQEMLEREGSVSSETTASVMTAIHVPGKEGKDHQPILKSSSESLRQISLQLSGLMLGNEGTEGVPDAAVSELERRNAELAALLQQEREASQKQTQLSNHLKSQLEKVEAELAAARGVLSSAPKGGGAWEVESLREQLQVHIQTIGILVAEKSELESKLTQTDHVRKRKAEEVNELEGRLSASRQRVREVEAKLAEVTSDRNNTTGLLETHQRELEASKATNLKTNKLCDELRATVAELTERLSVKTQDFDKLLTQLSNTKSQLAMANLHNQQLRDNVGESQLEKVLAEHRETQKQLEASQTELAKATTENSQMAAHYQHYTAELATQTQALQEQIAQLTLEKGELTTSLQDMESKLKVAQQTNASEGEEPGQWKAEKEHLSYVITSLQEEMLQLKENNAALKNDNSQLSKLVDQLSHNVEGLEMEVERSKTKEVDTSQLLEAMQSDKVAAARALTQNKQLKEQLEELQSGFIIMSNKKLELTEKLEKELHLKKHKNQEITSLNEMITNLKQEALQKEREIAVLREKTESLSGQLVTAHSHSHLEENGLAHDHLAQENITLTEQIKELEDKLKLSKVEIEDLTRQNSELHTLITEYKVNPSEEKDQNDTSPCENSDDEATKGKLLGKVATLTSEVSRLESECSSLQIQLDCERDKYNKLLGESLAHENSPEDVITEPKGETRLGESELEQKLQHLQEAHSVLESRFTRSMKEVAELSDEKQQLEHVVAQLQLETESIGDYITIYQFQRGVMKQQARERELELASLHHEREEMKQKITTLQDLISKLVQEKEAYHDLEQLEKISSVLKSPVAITNGVGTSDSEPSGNNGEMGDNHLKHSGEEEQHQETENCVHNSLPEEGIDAVSTLDTDVPHEANVNPTEHTHRKTKTITAATITTTTTTTAAAAAATKSPTVQRILDLLNEMESTSQLEHSGLQKFHPCPLCSGKLITV